MMGARIAKTVVDDWIDGNTELRCVIVADGFGTSEGYVAVGPDHPWYEQCHNCDLYRHRNCQCHSIRSVIKIQGELNYSAHFVGGLEARDDEWWFGFTNPAGDNESVRSECGELALQLMLAGFAWNTI